MLKELRGNTLHEMAPQQAGDRTSRLRSNSRQTRCESAYLL